MKKSESKSLSGVFASLALGVSLFAFAAPGFAQDAATAPAASAPAAETPAASAPAPVHEKDVEGRITSLHNQLKITSDQEKAWSNVADAMRNNASIMRGLMTDRENGSIMTALQDLKSYQAITQAHADGLQKLIDAFTPLYNSMPEAQQKIADKVFSRHIEHSGRK